jgi:nicotinamide riboside kinase
MKKPIVINLAGPPGAGKSTGAAYLFYKLKTMGINAELVTEFAKDKTWEHNMKALGVQEYVFGKQSYRMARCRDDVDVIVTDSPLLLGLLYNNNPALDDNFTHTVLNVFNTYDNVNIMINRVRPYSPKGRNQTEEESIALGKDIKALYDKLGVTYIEVNGDEEGYEDILKRFIHHYGIKLPNKEV